MKSYIYSKIVSDLGGCGVELIRNKILNYEYDGWDGLKEMEKERKEKKKRDQRIGNEKTETARE
jgi:hypothetical protein